MHIFMEDIPATPATRQKSEDFSHEEWRELIDSDYWKVPPNWTRAGDKKQTLKTRIRGIPKKIYEFLVVRITYEDYFASQLRSRYMDLEGKFRASLPENLLKNKDTDLPVFIKELLILAKQILEKQKLGKMDLIYAATLLDEAEERMIWIIPMEIKISKIHEIIRDLDRFSREIKGDFEKLLQSCEIDLRATDQSKDYSEKKCNAAVEEIVRAINKDILAKRINTGLQIERLRSLRFWGFILLIIYVFLFPMLGLFDQYFPYNNLTGYLKETFVDTNSLHIYRPLIPVIGGWAVALSFCIIGGIGGFLSGLLQVRNTETNLEAYEEAVLLFQVRPIFGAFAGLVMFMLISMGSLSSVFSSQQETMVLAAFLSGFSERYFLKLLKTESESENTKKTIEEERSKIGDKSN